MISNALYLFLIADAQDYFDINPSTGEILLVNRALSRGNRYALLVKVSALWLASSSTNYLLSRDCRWL